MSNTTYKYSTQKQRNTNKKWKEKDIQFLISHYPTSSIKYMKQVLGRSEDSIRSKAQKLGIKRTYPTDMGFTLLELSEFTNIAYTTLKKWIDNGLPHNIYTINRRTIVFVLPEDFWKYVEEHKATINFSNFCTLAILPEPNWFYDERKKEKIKGYKYTRRNFTVEELNKIEFLLQRNYTYAQIAEELGRTYASIKRATDRYNLRRKKGGIKIAA